MPVQQDTSGVALYGHWWPGVRAFSVWTLDRRVPLKSKYAEYHWDWMCNLKILQTCFLGCHVLQGVSCSQVRKKKVMNNRSHIWWLPQQSYIFLWVMMISYQCNFGSLEGFHAFTVIDSFVYCAWQSKFRFAGNSRLIWQWCDAWASIRSGLAPSVLICFANETLFHQLCYHGTCFHFQGAERNSNLDKLGRQKVRASITSLKLRSVPPLITLRWGGPGRGWWKIGLKWQTLPITLASPLLLSRSPAQK